MFLDNKKSVLQKINTNKRLIYKIKYICFKPENSSQQSGGNSDFDANDELPEDRGYDELINRTVATRE